MLEIKKEWRNKTKMVKTDYGYTIFFDGNGNYTQDQLKGFSNHEYFKEFVCESEDNIGLEDTEKLEFVYINTIKNVKPDDEVVKKTTKTTKKKK